MVSYHHRTNRAARMYRHNERTLFSIMLDQTGCVSIDLLNWNNVAVLSPIEHMLNNIWLVSDSNWSGYGFYTQSFKGLSPCGKIAWHVWLLDVNTHVTGFCFTVCLRITGNVVVDVLVPVNVQPTIMPPSCQNHISVELCLAKFLVVIGLVLETDVIWMIQTKFQK